MVRVHGSTRTLGKILPFQGLPPLEVMDLLGDMYETLLREDRWPEVLADLADMFDAVDAAFLEWADDYSSVRYFVSSRRAHTEESEALFRDHYGLLDPGVPLGRQSPVGGAANCVDFFSQEVVDSNEYYQGFLLPTGLRYRMAIKVRGEPDSAAFLFLYRREEQGPFGLEQMQLLSHFDSHLRRLAKLHAEIHRLRYEKREMADILDRQASAFITTNRHGRVRTISHPASKMLLAQDGLLLSNGVLEAIRPEITRQLRTVISLACAPAPAGREDALRLPRRNGREPLVCIATPGRIGLGHAAYVILAIADPLVTPPMTGRHMTDLYGLTSAEARLACDLVEGKSIEAIATKRGVAVSTVRTQLSSTLKKCGVPRQVDLIRLLCRLPALGRPS